MITHQGRARAPICLSPPCHPEDFADPLGVRGVRSSPMGSTTKRLRACGLSLSAHQKLRYSPRDLLVIPQIERNEARVGVRFEAIPVAGGGDAARGDIGWERDRLEAGGRVAVVDAVGLDGTRDRAVADDVDAHVPAADALLEEDG